MKEKTILLFYSNYSSFVAKDEEILKKKYNVIKYRFHLQKNIFKMLWELVKQFLFVVTHIWKADVVFSWFSDFYSLLPFVFAKMSGKKTIVIVGGYDAVAIPELNYGLFNKKDVRQLFGTLSFKLSDYILPVDKSLIKSTNYYIDKHGLKVGVRNYVSNLKAIIKVVPTGYDFKFWKAIPGHRSKSVVAFGFASNMQKFVGKWHEFLIRIAERMPDTQFTIIGIDDLIMPYARSIASENVTLFNSLDQDELLYKLSHSKVYALFSMSEGMPSSLCEAMLMGCVPVGSNVGGIKSIIGDCGFVLEHQDIDKAVVLVQKALNTSNQMAALGRERIIDLFPSELRANELYKIVS